MTAPRYVLESGVVGAPDPLWCVIRGTTDRDDAIRQMHDVAVEAPTVYDPNGVRRLRVRAVTR